MAHGSKKWIVDATGHLRKSHDRTKKDYYARVDHWDEYASARWNRYYGKVLPAGGDFCPQCKGIQKEYVEEHHNSTTMHHVLQAAYEKEYGFQPYSWLEIVDSASALPYWKWCRERGEEIDTNGISFRWSYHWRNTLCYKHERWEEARRDKWSTPFPGNRANYRWWVKNCRRVYRNKVRNVMQQAHYIHDYEGYDDIPQYRRPWLD